MKQLLLGLLLIITVALLVGCEPEPRSGYGMVLPAGDVAAGRDVFLRFGCHECHSVAGVELPAWTPEQPMDVELGGRIIKVKTYGELITSVTNPQHSLAPQARPVLTTEERELGESPMPYFNDRMTVEQLIDLVAFLESHYEKLRPDYTGYEYVR